MAPLGKNINELREKIQLHETIQKDIENILRKIIDAEWWIDINRYCCKLYLQGSYKLISYYFKSEHQPRDFFTYNNMEISAKELLSLVKREIDLVKFK